MTNKVLASSLVILAALGLAGCTNSAAAPTKTSISATKVSQQTSKKAASSTSSEKAKKQTPNSVQSTSAINTSSKVKVANSSEKLTDQTTKATSSSVTSNPSSQSVTTNSSSQNDQQVLTSFVKTSGVQQDGNHYYMTKNNQNNNYQIEVRNNQGGDPNVAHLTGTYQYDPATNQIHEMNPITGNYDN